MTFTSKFKSIAGGKFFKDGLWLVASQGILAIAGIAINLLITTVYGINSFGLFSVGLKIYLVLSLIGVVGCGASIVRYYSVNENKDKHEIIYSALFIGFTFSLLISILGYFLTPLLSELFQLENYSVIYYFLPGIPFFAVNKVNLSVLNAQRKIRRYAILQSTRWILILLFLLIFTFIIELEFYKLLLIFPLTELVLLPFCWLSIKGLSFGRIKVDWQWVKNHLKFGSQTMLSSTIIDLYNYADVFMISLFINNTAVGIYSFAADISKNLFVIANVIGINFNPIVASHWHENKLSELKALIKNVIKNTYLLYLPIVTLAIGIYFLALKYFLPEELMESLLPFVILSVGVLAFSGVKTIYALPELTGRPQGNLAINFIVLILNVILNYILLKFYQMNGVAMATAITYIFSILLLYIYSKRYLNFKIVL